MLSKPYDVVYEERPIPKLESPHDVLVAINYTGICGSDVHYVCLFPCRSFLNPLLELLQLDMVYILDAIEL